MAPRARTDGRPAWLGGDDEGATQPLIRVARVAAEGCKAADSAARAAEERRRGQIRRQQEGNAMARIGPQPTLSGAQVALGCPVSLVPGRGYS